VMEAVWAAQIGNWRQSTAARQNGESLSMEVSW
jgi:hypothetical protein